MHNQEPQGRNADPEAQNPLANNRLTLLTTCVIEENRDVGWDRVKGRSHNNQKVQNEAKRFFVCNAVFD